MNILGVGCVFPHDPAAALLVDGRIVAAVEEERFTRQKHALDQWPSNAIAYCLQTGGLRPNQIDVVALPWSRRAYRRDQWGHLRRLWRTSLSHGVAAIRRGARFHRRLMAKNLQALCHAGFDPDSVEVAPVEHHVAHAASAYHLSGWGGAAILTIDGQGEFTSTMVAEGNGPHINVHRRILTPDSLGYFYSVITEYLGFQMNDGEYKVMGMSAYGDPTKVDVSPFIQLLCNGYRVNERHIWPRTRHRVPGKKYSPFMVEHWGPPREGDDLAEPYIHVAAAAQKVLEDAVLALIDRDVAPILKRHDGRLCLAGGCALNVRMNRRILGHPSVNEVYVQPAAHDSGAPFGAAAFVAAQRGERLRPMTHPYFGPNCDDDITSCLSEHGNPAVTHTEDQCIDKAVDLLAAGQVVAWCQGRMEFGPRALGNRSILAHPARAGIADQINLRIKFREPWRPFCPSVLAEHAASIFALDHPSPFMNLSFMVRDEWRTRIPEAVHVDGSARPQTVTRRENPLFHRLISAFHERTGVPVLLNPSLNRRGEPMVCSARDALNMFNQCGLEHLFVGNTYVIKRNAVEIPEDQTAPRPD